MTMLSSLTPQRRHFVLELQDLQFGIIKGLAVVDHQPVFSKETKGKRRVAVKTKNQQAKQYPADFKIKQDFEDFFAVLDQMENGTISEITVRRGLPKDFAYETELEVA